MDNIKRCCRTCKYLLKQHGQHVCYEGGFSEIGDINKKLSMNDCNAWQEKLCRCLKVRNKLLYK